MRQRVLSFIITIYNTPEERIRRLFNSFKEDIKQFEFICVDDASNNKESITYIEKKYGNCENFKIIKLEHNTKRMGAYVKGIMSATSKYLHSLDSDDEVKIKHLKKATKILEKVDYKMIIFPFYWRLKHLPLTMKSNGVSNAKVTKITKFKHWNTWPAFAAYNTCVLTSIAQDITYDTSLQGPHDDAYFSAEYLNKAKEVYAINVAWFIYHKVNESIKLALLDKDKLLKNIKAHEQLLLKSTTLIDPSNFLTYVQVHSLLISHLNRMNLLYSIDDIKKWYINFWNTYLEEKIADKEFWKFLRFYKKTQNDPNNLSKLLEPKVN